MPLTIALVTTYDSSNVGNWSGIPYHMGQALERAGARVVRIGPLRGFPQGYHHFRRMMYRSLQSRQYLSDRDVPQARYYAAQVDKVVKSQDIDYILAPSPIPVAFLKSEVPVAIWNDAVFGGLVGYYPSAKRPAKTSLKGGYAIEDEALSSARIVALASRWAAETAVRHHDLSQHKLHVIPFGGNMPGLETHEETERIIERRREDKVCRLLFVGVNWNRKGGPIAHQCVSELNRRGIQAELHVVGCEVPESSRQYTVSHGYLRKGVGPELRQLEDLFMRSHFLFMPSRMECYGLVYAEASSYGVPSIATDTGGVSEVVRHGVNGLLLEYSAEGERYADAIEILWRDKYAYMQMSGNCLSEYRDRLNWSRAAARMMELMVATV